MENAEALSTRAPQASPSIAQSQMIHALTQKSIFENKTWQISATISL